MSRLGRIVGDELVYVVEWSPDAFCDGEEDRDFLGGSEKIV